MLLQGFSVIQEANLMVQSFPRAPNIFALLEQLAIVPDEGGKPLAADFQQKDGESSLIPSHFFPKVETNCISPQIFLNVGI